jgi:serine/threonine protein phosphatase 1
MFKWLYNSKSSEQLAIPQPHVDHRIYAIGDVHGRDDLLAGLLVKLRADAAQQPDERKPILIFLGDLIDRGDHSKGVLDLALQEIDHWPEIIFLRGNHEASLLSFLDSPKDGAPWLGFGGKQTLASYGVPVPKINAERDELEQSARALSLAMGPHVGFLNKTVLIYRSGDVIFAHSGIDPEKPLNMQDEKALLWGRSSFLEKGVSADLRVVHGHWDVAEPVVSRNRLGLDTGAYYSGKLTAARLDAGTEIISVDVFDL